ncbi:MAG: hypothetical protein KGJ62_02560 [Armatimonadetes bacterium]|nr:hypothetical protein [Armatimonadota bacterium]MDE2205297.1 hypothetical protein [Armatimonadota bacterium]
MTVKARHARNLSMMDAVTIAGMLTAIGSLFGAWERYTPAVQSLGLPGALVSHVSLQRSGFQSSVRWPITVAALATGGLLLWNRGRNARLYSAVLQAGCGAACVAMAMAHLALLGGVIGGFAAGTLILFGAWGRSGASLSFGSQEPQP